MNGVHQGASCRSASTHLANWDLVVKDEKLVVEVVQLLQEEAGRHEREHE